MPVITDTGGKLYTQVTYELESDFEAAVVGLADQMFGSSTIYVDVKKRMSGNDIVTIPDGYIIDMTEPDSPRLFIVENEIVKHDPFKHIGIQLLKFATSFEEAKTHVRNFLMEAIAKNQANLARLKEACQNSSKRNIDNYLDDAVYAPFSALVVIDEARNELHRVLEKINANISVLELRARPKT